MYEYTQISHFFGSDLHMSKSVLIYPVFPIISKPFMTLYNNFKTVLKL